MKWIDNIILGLIEMYNTNDAYDLLDYLNIKIIDLDETNILLNGNEAFYCRDYFEDEVIFIKNNLSMNYRKFILAHELAHAVIHTWIPTAAFNNNLLNKGKLEKQADYFAIKLLNLELDPIELKDMTLEQIASCLEVPFEPLKQLANI